MKRRATRMRLMWEFHCGLSMIGLARKWGMPLAKVEDWLRWPLYPRRRRVTP